jgi:hypothetical protein
VRRVLAAVIDVAVVGVAGFLAFQLAVRIAPCPQGQCPLLAPLAIGLIVVVLAVYFGGGHLLWHSTPGERASGLTRR